jgi:hypothetical protein
MLTRPKFSVIAVDYEFHVPRPGMIAGLDSLANQTFKDFELIICHDGPKYITYQEEYDFASKGLDPIIINTPERMNNWGHSGRDMAMKIANGEYFIHFNIDNIFYPNAFEELNKKIESVDEKIIIFLIKHWKWLHHLKGKNGLVPVNKNDPNGALFRGIPPIFCNIDCMQLVAHRDIWEEMNYWYDTDINSDGIIYEEMCKRYPWAELDICLGENN